MFEMKAPNGNTLTARDEQQKQIMERAGYVEVIDEPIKKK